jgi:hypothetical protein
MLDVFQSDPETNSRSGYEFSRGAHLTLSKHGVFPRQKRPSDVSERNEPDKK